MGNCVFVYICSMTVNAGIFDKVRQVFNTFLETKKLRKTSERWDILEEIYSREGHFDVESLYQSLKEKGYTVSRATVYNTMDLLVECNLVKKHQFDQNQAQYEKAFGFRQHDHIICTECHRVTEFCDPRIQNIQKTVSDLLHFEVIHHSLILYGNCTKENCEHRSSN